MRILDSSVALTSQREFQAQRSQQLRITSVPASSPASEVNISAAAQAIDVDALDEAIENDPRLVLIRDLLAAMTGYKTSLKHFKAEAAPASASTPQAGAPPSAMTIQYSEQRSESETTQFSASGTVNTSDGREIHFEAELTMSRQFAETIQIDIRSGQAERLQKDPLVLNIQAPSAALSSQTFQFDLDSDGKLESISLLKSGSAYVALDRNQDGKINNGKELFGAQSGDGFADLSEFDQDHNQWLDDNDATFAKLTLWLKDDSGTEQIRSLKSMGIGAIYLGRVATQFALNDGQNQSLGQIRKSGVYLNEDGSGGRVKQISLAI